MFEGLKYIITYPDVFDKKVFLKILQNLYKIPVRESHLMRFQVFNLHLHYFVKVLFREFYEIFMNRFFIKHLYMAASLIRFVDLLLFSSTFNMLSTIF